MTQNGYALQYAHHDLRKDPDIGKAAVSQNFGALLFAPEDLKRDPEAVSPSVMADVVSGLKHEDGQVRSAAARVLGGLGSVAGTAVPALVELLWDHLEGPRVSAVEALKIHKDALGPDVATSLVNALLVNCLFAGETMEIGEIIITIGEPAVPDVLRLVKFNNY